MFKQIRKPIAFLRNPTFLGQSYFGVNVAPYMLINKQPGIDYNLDHTYESFLSQVEINNLRDNTPEQIHELIQKQPFLEKFKTILLENLEINHLNKRLQNEYSKVLNIGGDHSTALGSVSASLEKHGDELKVVWIDAQPDLNTFYESDGNINDMSVNYLMGLERRLPEWLKEHKLKPEQLIYIGVRNMSKYEEKVIQALGIECITSNEIKEHGITELLNVYQDETFSKVHLSLDLNVLDPEIFPSVGRKVENGLTNNDVIDIINYYFSKMTCMDLVEFNPYIGNGQEVNKSKHIVADLLKYIYDKSLEEETN